MTKRRIALALMVPLSLGIAACQTAGTSGISGQWASADGVSVTSFTDGNFVTRVVSTNEVVAEGRYQEGADGIQMSWFSVVANEQRSAVCRYASRTQLSCTPRGGTPFTMSRIA